MIKISVLIMTAVALVVSKTTRDCGGYKDNWRISACASNLRQNNLITEEKYVEYLVQAIEASESNGNFYGLGLTTGNDKYIMAGKMSKPVLRQGLGFNYDPSSLYYEKVYIDLGETFDRPVTLYLVNDIDGIPEWSNTMLTRLIPTGQGERYTVFRSEKSGRVDPKDSENCSGLAKWIDGNLSGKKKGLAVVMGQDHWCPILRDGLTEIVLAKVIKEKRLTPAGQTVDHYVVEWAKWGSGSFGEVPAEYMTVFQ